MSDPARTVFIALDACDASTMLAMMSRGDAPNLSALRRHAGRCRVRNPHGLFVGAVWHNFATGLSPLRHREHCWDEIDPATYERRLSDSRRDRPAPFWVGASDAGRRVAVLDVPHDRAVRPVDGINLVEWGCHDRHHGLHSWPPEAASEMESAYGLHPILGVDARLVRDFAPDDYVLRDGPFRTGDEERELFAGLVDGVVVKRRLSSAVLEQGGWDLFLTVFGESHAVGHQLWHLHDVTHPRFDPVRRRVLGADPIEAIYGRLDTAVGELLAVAGDDATVFVLLSHGMGPHYDGTHLLDEVLHRIDLVDRGGGRGAGWQGAAKWTLGALPSVLQQRATAVATPWVRQAVARRRLAPGREFVSAAERAEQRFFLEPNNFAVGGIRLNLAGREPRGCVEPGEADVLVDGLRADLLALVNVDTGGAVVRSVEPAAQWYPERGWAHDTMPDLFVEWERSALIETVWSPKVGVVHVPYENWRTGDHRPDGLLFARGPGIPGGAQLPSIAVEDLGPTILASLGVAALDGLDGRAASWLAHVPAV